jgi:AcrR family transcriptional regulator
MGRQKEFDTEVVLEEAMKVFWRKGYDGASITDLTEAMGIARPSLYSTFGTKEELFEAALARYEQGPSSYLEGALAQPTSRQVAEELLRGAADLHADPASPAGCMSVQGALVGAEDAGGPTGRLAISRNEAERRVRLRLEGAVEEGDLPDDADPAALAAFLRTVTYGMAVRAASGADRDELQAVIDQALRSWPSD